MSLQAYKFVSLQVHKLVSRSIVKAKGGVRACKGIVVCAYPNGVL